MNDNYSKLPTESFDDYFVRLFQNKNVYGLTCEQVADLLNTESGNTYTESKWRKDFKRFSQGMNYARKKYGQSYLAEQTRELEKQRFLLSEERAALKKIVRDSAKRDAFLDEMKKQFSQVEPFEAPAGCEVTGTEEGTLLAVLSDWHIGINYSTKYGVYNSDIAKQYVADYIEYVKSMQKTFSAEKCVVALAGDLISGVIHNTIRIESREDLVRQIKIASELVSMFVNGISGCFSQIDVYGVGGNHSRVMDKDNSTLGEMLDDLIPFYVNARVGNLDNIKIHERQDDTGFESFYIGNLHTVLVHGEFDSMSESSIAKLERLLGGIVDVIICGHLHENMFSDLSGVHIIRGGTLGGSGDQYTLKNRLNCQPSQAMAYFDKDSKLRAVLPVYF